jgi:hypothetical protein
LVSHQAATNFLILRLFPYFFFPFGDDKTTFRAFFQFAAFANLFFVFTERANKQNRRIRVSL